MKEHITIPRKESSKDLYVSLQDAALQRVQRYSGELWTDFNEHDPGVTVMDALNYALLETDYRLQFDIQDYLAPEKEDWPVANALFPPLDMFPVNPVTGTDYRKLFVSSVDGLKNVWVSFDVEQGLYNFILDIYPDTSPERKKEISNEVRELYHAHRNLCENIGGIRFLVYEPVALHADVELDEEISVNRMMARIYFETQQFLNAEIRFRRVEELLDHGETADEILDGPLQKKMVVDQESIAERKTAFDLSILHGRLRDLPGVVRVNSLAFEWRGILFTNHIKGEHALQSFTAPFSSTKEHTVVLCKGGKSVLPNADRVSRILTTLQAEWCGCQQPNTDKSVLESRLSSTYRDMYSHSPIWNDLPACYRKAKDFREYLDVFDQFIAGVLRELKELPSWMRVAPHHLSNKKELWMDMLDQLYGVDSNPEYLKNSEAIQENRIRRAIFLNMIPKWGYERGCGRDLRKFSQDRLSGVERYMKGLLNLDKYGLKIILLEHCLLDAKESFVVSVILSVNDKYQENNEFICFCEGILRSRIPAHIQLHIYWQDEARFKLFETDYVFWKYTLSASGRKGLTELAERLKRRLADDQYWYGKV